MDEQLAAFLNQQFEETRRHFGKFSYAELDRRISRLESSTADLEARVTRLETSR